MEERQEILVRLRRRRLAPAYRATVDLDRESTGFHKIEDMSFLPFLRKFFPLKSPTHPVRFTTFSCMVVPKASLLPIVSRIWRDTARPVLRAFVGWIHA